MQGPRAQADRMLYREAIQEMIFNQENLCVLEAGVEDVKTCARNTVSSVETSCGLDIKCKSVVLTTGTFLRGMIHCGNNTTPAGRIGDAPAIGLAKTLERMDFKLGRLKTGTPPRLDGKTINWKLLEPQPGDTPPEPMSYLTSQIACAQRPCHITYTNPEVHKIIQDNIHLSAIYSGKIEGVGPRYCPSIEDKVVRFADRGAHQIFLEPEGIGTDEIYVNGFSTCLPFEVQYEMVLSLIHI